jgi:hypothetical protein
VSQFQFLSDVSAWVVLTSFWVSFLFIPLVSTFWPWWRTPFSKSLMFMEALIPVALLPGALRRMFGISLLNIGFLWFEITAVALITPAIAWRIYATWKLQRDRSNENT